MGALEGSATSPLAVAAIKADTAAFINHLCCLCLRGLGSGPLVSGHARALGVERP